MEDRKGWLVKKVSELSDSYKIFGSELSPYSVKVRSYFRYKKIPHEWTLRSEQNLEEFERFAKLPLVPLVVTPEQKGIQDSTPIIEQMESLFPEPSIHPENPALAFISALIEEYGDEWVNKPMFHYRWTYVPDQWATAERIARQVLGDANGTQLAERRQAVRDRMIGRLAFVGSSEQTRQQIEDSLANLLSILEAHLAERLYLFGGRPAFGDFGLAAQLYQCSTDPTPSALMRERAPKVLGWVQRMLAPSNNGPFEPWDALAPTLVPLLETEIGKLFLPWSTANARALQAADQTFSLELKGRKFSQQPQKYHARSLGVLKARYAAMSDTTELEPTLAAAGCLQWLRTD